MTIIVIAAVTIFGTMSISCRTTENSQIVTYVDEENGFSIDYPDNWNIETPSNPPELKVSIYEKKIGINPVGIMVGKYKAPGYNLESFTEFRKGFLSDTGKDYISISTEQIMIGNMPAIKHFYTESVGPTLYKIVEISMFDENIGWIVRFNSPEKSFDNYETIYDTALNSFSLLK